MPLTQDEIDHLASHFNGARIRGDERTMLEIGALLWEHGIKIEVVGKCTQYGPRTDCQFRGIDLCQTGSGS